MKSLALYTTGIILLTSGVVFAQSADISLPVSQATITPDATLSSKIYQTEALQALIASTSLSSIDAVNADLNQQNTKAITDRLDKVVELLSQIARQTKR